MREITGGLLYLHKSNIAHRDIKPENILMMYGIPKISDFGLAKVMKSSGSSTAAGTLFYAAPEVIHSLEKSRL
jgi:serine/threonine protein kinase